MIARRLTAAQALDARPAPCGRRRRQDDGWQQPLARVLADERGPALTRLRRDAASTSAGTSPGLGRVSASRKTTTSPLAARSPCSSAQTLPAQPSGSGAPGPPGAVGGGDLGRPVGRLVVDDEHLGDARRILQRREHAGDPRLLVARRDTTLTVPEGAGAPGTSGGFMRRPRASAEAPRKRGDGGSRPVCSGIDPSVNERSASGPERLS
jgi:hypothetical protein